MVSLFFEIRSRYAALADLEFIKLCLPLPPEYWDKRHAAPHLTWKSILSQAQMIEVHDYQWVLVLFVCFWRA